LIPELVVCSRDTIMAEYDVSMKAVRFPALYTGRLYHPPGNIPGTHFC
jgi:hypothetical protein